jgi:hypothetical protein
VKTANLFLQCSNKEELNYASLPVAAILSCRLSPFLPSTIPAFAHQCLSATLLPAYLSPVSNLHTILPAAACLPVFVPAITRVPALLSAVSNLNTFLPAAACHTRACYHTAKILYRKFETCILRKGTARPQSQFLHSCFCV